MGKILDYKHVKLKCKTNIFNMKLDKLKCELKWEDVFEESLNWFKIWTSLCKSDARLKSLENASQGHSYWPYLVFHRDCVKCVIFIWNLLFIYCEIALLQELVNAMQTALLGMYSFPPETKLMNP